jgi:hypothetical protein
MHNHNDIFAIKFACLRPYTEIIGCRRDLSIVAVGRPRKMKSVPRSFVPTLGATDTAWLTVVGCVVASAARSVFVSSLWVSLFHVTSASLGSDDPCGSHTTPHPQHGGICCPVCTELPSTLRLVLPQATPTAPSRKTPLRRRQAKRLTAPDRPSHKPPGFENWRPQCHAPGVRRRASPLLAGFEFPPRLPDRGSSLVGFLEGR